MFALSSSDLGTLRRSSSIWFTDQSRCTARSFTLFELLFALDHTGQSPAHPAVDSEAGVPEATSKSELSFTRRQ